MLRIPAESDGIVTRQRFPRDHQDVAVRERADVVVSGVLLVGEEVVPEQRPSHAILCTRPPMPPPWNTGLSSTRAQRRIEAVVAQVHGAGGWILARPLVNDRAVEIDQVRRLREERRVERVALEDSGFAQDEAALLGGFLGCRFLRRGAPGEPGGASREGAAQAGCIRGS